MLSTTKSFSSLSSLQTFSEKQTGDKLGHLLSGTEKKVLIQTADFTVYAMINFGSPAMVYDHNYQLDYKNKKGEVKTLKLDFQSEVESAIEEIYKQKAQ